MLQLWKVRDAVERFEGMLVLQVAGLVGLVSLKSGLVGLYCCILYTAYCILDTVVVVVVVVVCCCLLLFVQGLAMFCGSVAQTWNPAAYMPSSLSLVTISTPQRCRPLTGMMWRNAARS